MEWGNGDTHLFMKGLNLIYLVQCYVNVTDKCDIETDCEIVGEREIQKERERSFRLLHHRKFLLFSFMLLFFVLQLSFEMVFSSKTSPRSYYLNVATMGHFIKWRTICF